MDFINSKQSFILLVSNFLKFSLPLRTGYCLWPLDFCKVFLWDIPSSPSTRWLSSFVKYTSLARDPVNRWTILF